MDASDPFRPIADLSPSDWRPDSPTHIPAWRWLRARWLFETKSRASTRFDDLQVTGARDFLVKQAKYAAAQGKRKPARPDPVIEAAIEFARDADPLQRGKLEAYLLTGMSFFEIAPQLDLSTMVVSTYHDLFFAVRDHPAACDWLMLRAIGCGPWNDYAGPHPVGIWKYGAFSGGALLLELLIAITTDRPFPAWIRETFGEHAAEYERRLRLLAKTTVALMTERCQAQIEKLLVLRAQLDRMNPSADHDNMEAAFLRVQTGFLQMVETQRNSDAKSIVLPCEETKPELSVPAKRPRKPRADPSKQRSSTSGVEHVPE